MNFDKELEVRTKLANQAINEWLPKARNSPGELIEAMKYSVLAGGKRVRPILMGECYKLFGGDKSDIAPFQAAIEFVHTASLVHDDLPAIDNDLIRRGKKTTHAQYGEAIGILAGDALLNYAYEVLIEGVLKAGRREFALRAANIIAEKSGYHGMLGGQDVDVEVEKKGLKGDELEILDYIYEQKTAALIEASMMAGAALAGADESKLHVLQEIGKRIGLAFQIQDDILDVTGTTQSMGKSVFSDLKNKKETYVNLIGIEEASEKVNTLTKEAIEMLKDIPGDTEFLRGMIYHLASRDK